MCPCVCALGEEGEWLIFEKCRRHLHSLLLLHSLHSSKLQVCHYVTYCIYEYCKYKVFVSDIFKRLVEWCSVITVSHWLRLIGFGSVLGKKLHFCFSTVWFSDQCQTWHGCLMMTRPLGALMFTLRLLDANFMGGWVTKHCWESRWDRLTALSIQ